MVVTKTTVMICFAIVGFSPFILPAIPSAEDLLTKDGNNYLGWGQPGGKFITCQNNTISVGKGKIKRTDQLCIPPSPCCFFGRDASPFRITGEVEHKDAQNNTLKLRENFGSTKAFYYLPKIEESDVTDRKNIEFKDITIGEKITITGPTEGRADTIIMEGKSAANLGR